MLYVENITKLKIIEIKDDEWASCQLNIKF